MYEIKKIGLVRPMGNTLGVRPMGNSEANGQHFFEKHVCCPLVSPTVSIVFLSEFGVKNWLLTLSKFCKKSRYQLSKIPVLNGPEIILLWLFWLRETLHPGCIHILLLAELFLVFNFHALSGSNITSSAK